MASTTGKYSTERRRSFTTIEPLEARIAPAVFTVTNFTDNSVNDVHSLRGAITAANSHPGADTIVFKLPAPPAHGENVIKLTSGELLITDKLTIAGPGAGKLFIDGQSNSRIFHINDYSDQTDSPVTISGLSLVHGQADGGGAILSQESLTLKKCAISGNYTTSLGGGGVRVLAKYTPGTTVSITNCLISGNTAIGGGFGGGISLAVDKSFTVKNSRIVSNSSNDNGGGIYAVSGFGAADSGITISGSVVSGNSAKTGGGLFLKDNSTAPAAKITVSSTKITGNSTFNAGSGGGMYVTAGNAVITGSKIQSNTSASGGGGIAAISTASLTIITSTFSGNLTTGGNALGGGLFIAGSGSATPQQVKITSSHFTGNRSISTGGGLMADDGVALTISGSTFSGNQAFSSGGGIFTTGTGLNQVALNVTGSTFSDNASFGSGGGICAYGDGLVSITSSKVTGNISGAYGGGIYAKSAVVTNGVKIKNVVATGNIAGHTGAGGGLAISSTPNFRVSGGSFTGNDAEAGGGIYVNNSNGGIVGVTISGNTASAVGGGVFNHSGIVSLQIAKIIANSAPVDPDFSGTFTFIN